jgi:hypothetical protein
MVEFETTPVIKTIDYGCGITEQETRYILVERGTGKVLDDAQGYGYKTAQGAHKAGWYKFQKGRDQILSKEGTAKQFWEQNPAAGKELLDCFEDNFKVMYYDPTVESQIVSDIEKKYNIKIPEVALKNLDMADADYRGKWSIKNKKKKSRR